MSVVTRNELLEAGCQFGHQTKRWNPKMRGYIFCARDKIHIMNLKKTIINLDVAYDFVKGISANNGKVLFVGTKKQAKLAIQEAANRSNSPYVNERWLGGTLTNFKTIKSSIKQLIDIENKEKSGELKLLTKKEQMLIEKEKARLNRNFAGIRHMYKLPDVVFVTDTIINKIAIDEAYKLGIPIIAICDSNSDPDRVDYIIPGNDDANKSITLITNLIAKAILEGKEANKLANDKVETTESSETKVETEKAAELSNKTVADEAKTEINKP